MFKIYTLFSTSSVVSRMRAVRVYISCVDKQIRVYDGLNLLEFYRFWATISIFVNTHTLVFIFYPKHPLLRCNAALNNFFLDTFKGFCKQQRSRSATSWRCVLIRIYVVCYIAKCLSKIIWIANSIDPDQTECSVEADLALCSLQILFERYPEWNGLVYTNLF